MKVLSSFCLFGMLTACVTAPSQVSPMGQCKVLCSTQKVVKYKDDSVDCMCNIQKEE